MKDKPKALGILTLAILLAMNTTAQGQEWTLDREQLVTEPKPYSPFVDQHFAQNVYFGDTHFHSSLSVDSGLIGNKLGLEQAFRFARGEEVLSNTGQRVQLNKPLDFPVVSDHAEYLGVADLLNSGNPELLATDVGQKWYAAMREGGDAAWQMSIRLVDDFGCSGQKTHFTRVRVPMRKFRQLSKSQPLGTLMSQHISIALKMQYAPSILAFTCNGAANNKCKFTIDEKICGDPSNDKDAKTMKVDYSCGSQAMGLVFLAYGIDGHLTCS